jgi:hypothetical protein
MRRYTREDNEAYRKSIGREAGQEAEEHQERTQSQSLRRAWLADGGSEADFEKAWPALRDEGRRKRVVYADRRTREEMRAHGPSRI